MPTETEIHALEVERNKLVRELHEAATRRNMARGTAAAAETQTAWEKAVEKYRAVDQAYMEAIHGL